MDVDSARENLLDLIEELVGVQGVRAALIATTDGAFANGQRTGLTPAMATDVAKTVRRMTVASATVGVPLEELVINFGLARMMVVPLHDESTLVVLLERDTAVATVRKLLELQIEDIREMAGNIGAARPDSASSTEPEDEIETLLHGALGSVLGDIQGRFAAYVERSGRSREDAPRLMREQMKEWLLCCSPSPYTFPLLLDGLAQVLDDSPDVRAAFMTEVQEVVRSSNLWSGAKAST